MKVWNTMTAALMTQPGALAGGDRASPLVMQRRRRQGRGHRGPRVLRVAGHPRSGRHHRGSRHGGLPADLAPRHGRVGHRHVQHEGGALRRASDVEADHAAIVGGLRRGRSHRVELLQGASLRIHRRQPPHEPRRRPEPSPAEPSERDLAGHLGADLDPSVHGRDVIALEACERQRRSAPLPRPTQRRGPPHVDQGIAVEEPQAQGVRRSGTLAPDPGYHAGRRSEPGHPDHPHAVDGSRDHPSRPDSSRSSSQRIAKLTKGVCGVTTAGVPVAS